LPAVNATSDLNLLESSMKYDPLVPPDPKEWLALGEQERIDLAEEYHRRKRVRLPDTQVHALFHAIVEAQIALGDEIPVRRTMERLMAEGLDRHEAIHAVGSVLAGHMHDLLQRPDAKRDADPNARYFAELERLTAKEWRRSG
jgi:hypothetical protein